VIEQYAFITLFPTCSYLVLNTQTIETALGTRDRNAQVSFAIKIKYQAYENVTM